MRLIQASILLNMKRVLAFHISTWVDIASSLAYIVAQIIFWQTIYTRVSPLPGLRLGDIYAFMAFGEIFYALSYSLFIVAVRFWTVINNGRLDLYLVRPVDPRLMVFLLNLRFENLIRPIPSIVLLFTLAVANGFFIGKIFSGLPLVLLAATTYAVIQLGGGLSAFWLGRARALEEITTSLTHLLRFPTTIFPGATQVILYTILPIGLAATEPVLQTFGFSYVLVLGLGIASLLFWLGLVEWVWQKGLQRYESYGS